ncbi:MAG: FeoB-associated Cys-rich membrane protein [Ruminococcaceae bacterium]|nr:FeoB-associated Cys-rich membrane protein [Oscillospiraceae bacterium]
METIFAIIIIVLILFLAVFYIYRAKKCGQKCIGCPYAKECSKQNRNDTFSS